MIKNLLKRAVSAIKGEKVLYFPGCVVSQSHPKISRNYRSMLLDAGVDFITIDEFKCCGATLLDAGYANEFSALKRNNLELLEKAGVNRITCSSPVCCRTLKKHYNLDTEHTVQTLDRQGYRPNPERGDVSYHDSCALTADGVFSEPRSLLKKKGLSISEPIHTKEKAMCCGACGGLAQNNPQAASAMAKARLSEMRSRTVVTACPFCYTHLSENIPPNSGKQVLELSEAIFDE